MQQLPHSDARATRMVYRFFNALPAWLFLLSGLVIVAAVVLVGPTLELQQLQYEQKRIEAKARVPYYEREALEQMHEALKANDPATIERLALVYRNLVRPGSQVVHSTEATPSFLHDSPEHLSPAELDRLIQADSPNPVEAWAQELARSRVAMPQPPDPVESTLVRLTTGPRRKAVLALGVVFLLLGMMPPDERRSRQRA